MRNGTTGDSGEHQRTPAYKYPGSRKEREKLPIPPGSVCVFKEEKHHPGELVVVLNLRDDESRGETYRVSDDETTWTEAKRSQLTYLTWGDGKSPRGRVRELIKRHGWRAGMRSKYDARSSRSYTPRQYDVSDSDIPKPKRKQKRAYKKRQPERKLWTRIDDELRVILTPGGALVLIGVVDNNKAILVPYTVAGSVSYWQEWLKEFEVG